MRTSKHRVTMLDFFDWTTLRMALACLLWFYAVFGFVYARDLWESIILAALSYGAWPKGRKEFRV